MTSSKTLIALAAAAGFLTLAACESDYGPASKAARRDAADLNRACRPGDTPAGTRSGLACDAGSTTGTPTGNDANVNGAGSAGSAPAVPDRP